MKDDRNAKILVIIFLWLFLFFTLRDEIVELGLDEVLIQIKNESSDRDAWRMADHGLMKLHNVKPVGKQSSLSSNKSKTSSGGLVASLPVKKALWELCLLGVALSRLNFPLRF